MNGRPLAPQASALPGCATPRRSLPLYKLFGGIRQLLQEGSKNTLRLNPHHRSEVPGELSNPMIPRNSTLMCSIRLDSTREEDP